MWVVVARQLEKDTWDQREEETNGRGEVFLQCALEQGTQLINYPNEALNRLLILTESARGRLSFFLLCNIIRSTVAQPHLFERM